jgi:protocatechuate 3,4-dioxygenase beta subunit
MTKLATAAVIAVAIVLGLRGTNETSAWAAVVRALNGTVNIHVMAKVTRPGGRVDEYRTWLKDGTMLRKEEPNEITIDDGQSRLILDREQKTAQLSDSRAPFQDYMETGNLEIILTLMGQDTPYTATELPKEKTPTERVYRMTYRDVWEGKAWVDARSNLPLRVWAEVTEEYRDRALDMEVIYSYEPIAPDVFDLTVPVGYAELPRVQPRVFSGQVLDEAGTPVADARVVTSNERIRGRTNEQGEFAIKLHPGRGLGGFPMMVRATRPGDPNHVAWTLLRNPRHELRPLYIPDDGKSKLEQGYGVDIQLVDENSLQDFIPPDPGTLVFQDETDRHPSEVHDIVLRMQPASVISGRVTDREGQPVVDALVWLGFTEIAVGENEIQVQRLGRMEEEERLLSILDPEDAEEVRTRLSFALTDADGRYRLGHLPAVWSRAYLEVKADGYVNVSKITFQDEGNDFRLTRADLTIRGTVIDDHGMPLVGREVEIDVDSDEEGNFEVEEVFTDAEGRFELTGVPAVEGLEVQVRADEKPYDWDENELTRGRPFIYYLMIEEPIALKPDEKEYDVTIVLPRPDITLTVEVKDAAGNPLAGAPVGVCSPGFTEREWYISELVGKTDGRGVCTINEVPRIDPLQLWIGGPEPGRFRDWESMPELSEELKNAIREWRGKHALSVVDVELDKEKKDYEVSVRL